MRRRRIAGIVMGTAIILAYAFLTGGALLSLTVPAPGEQDVIRAIEEIESVFPDWSKGMRALVIRRFRIQVRVEFLCTILSLLPFLVLGVWLVTGPGHRLWAWQNTRRGRHPILGGVLFWLGIFSLNDVVRWLLVPDGLILQALAPPRNPGLAAVTAGVCVPAAVWLYLGKRKRETLSASA